MSHSNTTANFGLPQFITTDKPAWLTDVNVAYNAIDTAMKNNQDAASDAQGDATQALSDAASALSTANTADSKAGGAVASISENFDTTSTYSVGEIVMYNNLLYKCIVAVSTPGPWTGTTNWTRENIDGLLGALDTKLSGEISTLNNNKADAEWTYLGKLYNGSSPIDISTYNEVICVWEVGATGGTVIHGTGNIYPVHTFTQYTSVRIPYYSSPNYYVIGDITYSSGNITYLTFSYQGWDIANMIIYAR